jgi:hypothetical protein
MTRRIAMHGRLRGSSSAEFLSTHTGVHMRTFSKFNIVFSEHDCNLPYLYLRRVREYHYVLKALKPSSQSERRPSKSSFFHSLRIYSITVCTSNHITIKLPGTLVFPRMATPHSNTAASLAYLLQVSACKDSQT